MTKLNYANRKSEGVRLGEIVKKDLSKSDPLSKTGAKGATKVFKTPIELNLAGKHLTDEGVAEFAEVLCNILTSRDGQPAPATLHTLNLQHNSLTAKGLALLGPAINAASDTLEDLDLSHNDVSIYNEDHQEDWEAFLESFSSISALKRLDLSHNDFSNFRIFERLAYVYVRHFDANSKYWDGDSDEGKPSATVDEKMSVLSLRDPNVPHASSSDVKTTAPVNHTPVVRGLPAVHIMSFEDVALNEYGALFLSYVIERHKYAQVDHNMRIWLHTKDDSDRACIDTAEDTELHPWSRKLLSEAETVPFHPHQHGEDSEEDDDEEPDATMGRRRSSVSAAGRRRSSAAVVSRRQSSLSGGELSSMPPLHRTSSYADLQNVRKKVQRSIIEVHGVRSVKLWAAALRMLPLVRHTMLRKKSEPIDLVETLQKNKEPQQVPALPQNKGPSPPPLSMPASMSPPTYASKLRFERTRGAPVLSILGDAPFPTTSPTVLKSQDHSRKASTSEKASSPSQRRSDRAEAESTSSVPQLKAAITTGESKPRMVGCFPEDLWVQVLKRLVDPEDVLTPAHVDGILAYACDRLTLEKERGLITKSDSARRWKVLEQMGCLMY